MQEKKIHYLDPGIVHENQMPKFGVEYAKRLAKIFNEDVIYTDSDGVNGIITKEERMDPNTVEYYDVSALEKKLTDGIYLKLENGEYIWVFNNSFIIYDKDYIIKKVFGGYNTHRFNKVGKSNPHLEDKVKSGELDDNRTFSLSRKEGRGYPGGHISNSDYSTYNAEQKACVINIDTTRQGNTSGYYPSMTYLSPVPPKSRSNIDFDYIYSTYDLGDQPDLSDNSKAKKIDLPTDSLVKEAINIMQSRNNDVGLSDYINYDKIFKDRLGISTINSPKGTELLIDKTISGGRTGRANLLLKWGFKGNYFVSNREAGWGHEQISYMINVTREEAIVIQKLWEKGAFNDNYAEAYYQIKGLLKTGKIPDLDDNDEE